MLQQINKTTIKSKSDAWILHSVFIFLDWIQD